MSQHCGSAADDIHCLHLGTIEKQPAAIVVRIWEKTTVSRHAPAGRIASVEG